MPEHVAFENEHHELVGSTDFPFDEVDDRLNCGLHGARAASRPEDAMAIAGGGLHEVLRWVWRRGLTQRASPTTAFRKFLALSATLRPELFDDATLDQLGNQVGCTKANLSKASLRFTKVFGLQFRRQHNGRENMRAAMLRSHQQRKQNEPSNQTEPRKTQKENR